MPSTSAGQFTQITDGIATNVAICIGYKDDIRQCRLVCSFSDAGSAGPSEAFPLLKVDRQCFVGDRSSQLDPIRTI